jgi:thiosulfate/3-mercaptopyruvate sulfurtransferase
MPYTTLISAADLSEYAQAPNWIVIDCRHDLAAPDAGSAAYAAGHIPGAQFAHLDRDLSDKSPGPNGEFRGRHPLPSREAFIESLRRWGVNPDSQVIAYDAHGGMFAARLWWMLRWVGHEAAAVLDGGLPAWQALGLPLSTEPVARSRGSIAPQPSLAKAVDVTTVRANLTNPEHTVIDARAPDRFRGENETLDPVGGHIPGAKNRFFKDNLQADGRFKPADQLRAEFATLVSEPPASIMQCGSGVTACHNLLACREPPCIRDRGANGAPIPRGRWRLAFSDRRSGRARSPRRP